MGKPGSDRPNRKELRDLLDQRPGYEVVYLLRQSAKQRQELIEHADCGEGTISNWLRDAEDAGLIVADTKRTDHGFARVFSLAISLPPDIEDAVDDRGQQPRDDYSDHGDVANFSKWTDDHSV